MKEIITNALVVESENGEISRKHKQLDLNSLGNDRFEAKDILVKVENSSLNYKDALALAGNAKSIIKKFPLAAGIDLAGSIVETNSDLFKIGDKILATGFGLGEKYWGGFSSYNYISKTQATIIPKSKDSTWAMSIGTAGLTAMMAVDAIINHGISNKDGNIAVSGASGGVGSFAILILKKLGYRVCAITSSEDNQDYLKSIGADEIILTNDFDEKPAPLSHQKYIAAIDTVGGQILSSLLSQIKYNGCVCSCGLAASFKLPTTVMPFILRGISLYGIESVYYPYQKRNALWQKLADIIDQSDFIEIIEINKLEELIKNAELQLANKLHSRKILTFNK